MQQASHNVDACTSNVVTLTAQISGAAPGPRANMDAFFADNTIIVSREEGPRAKLDSLDFCQFNTLPNAHKSSVVTVGIEANVDDIAEHKSQVEIDIKSPVPDLESDRIASEAKIDDTMTNPPKIALKPIGETHAPSQVPPSNASEIKEGSHPKENQLPRQDGQDRDPSGPCGGCHIS